MSETGRTAAEPEGISTPGGCRLYRYASAAGRFRPVVVAHGMFSSARDHRRLARHLAAAGHDTWTVDFRGHGVAAPLGAHEDFERAALADVADVIGEIRRRTGAPALTWIGHSGGGLAVLMYLARHPERRDAVHRLVLAASQATRAGDGVRNRTKLLMILAGLAAMPRVPGRRFGVGPGIETRAVLGQWCRWNMSGRWSGTGGFDYLEALGEIGVPTLALAGSGDRFIAPPAGCRAVHERLDRHDGRFVECGPDAGFARAYGHAEVLCSRQAAREIWPLVLDWIES